MSSVVNQVIHTLYSLLFDLAFHLRSARWGKACNPADWAHNKSNAVPVADAHSPLDGNTIVVTGFFDEVLGIGRAGRFSIKALQQAGFQVLPDALRPYQFGMLRKPPRPIAGADKAGVWLIHANAPECRHALFTHDHAQWQHFYRIAYWAWESTRAPRLWVRTAVWFHEIWVPSHFVRDALAKSFTAENRADLIARLKVMPHPLPEGEVAIPSQGNDASANATTGFKALTMFDPRSGMARKNPLGAVEAWVKAFPQPGAAHLTIKTIPEAGHESAIATLDALIRGRPDIEVIDQAMAPDELIAFIASKDVLLSLHRAEGFGLVLAEAMALGLCVMATGQTGNADFMHTDNSLPVSGRWVPAAKILGGPEALWIEPDVEEAVRMLRQIAHAPERIHKLGDAARLVTAQLNAPWQRARLLEQIGRDGGNGAN